MVPRHTTPLSIEDSTAPMSGPKLRSHHVLVVLWVLYFNIQKIGLQHQTCEQWHICAEFEWRFGCSGHYAFDFVPPSPLPLMSRSRMTVVFDLVLQMAMILLDGKIPSSCTIILLDGRIQALEEQARHRRWEECDGLEGSNNPSIVNSSSLTLRLTSRGNMFSSSSLTTERASSMGIADFETTLQLCCLWEFCHWEVKNW